MSKGLISVKENLQIAVKNAAPAFDITGLFNTHGNAEDARSTADHIPENSIVYVEGCSLSYELKTDPLKPLSLSRLYDGPTSRNYKELKSKAIRYNEALLEEPNIGFSHHGAQLAIELARRDCVAFGADLLVPKGHKYPDAATEEYFTHGSDGIGSPILKGIMGGEIDKPHGSERTLRNLSMLCARAFSYQHLRETHAVARVSDYTLVLSQMAETQKLAKSNDGKTMASIVYGTSHARTLTDKLSRAGFNIEPIIIDPIEEHEFIQDEGDYLVSFYFDVLQAASFIINADKTDTFKSEDLFALARAIDKRAITNGGDLLRRCAKVLSKMTRPDAFSSTTSFEDEHERLDHDIELAILEYRDVKTS